MEEKAVLIVIRTKKGKINCTLKFENGKTMPFPALKLMDTSLHNSDVSVERVKGQPVYVKKTDGSLLFEIKERQKSMANQSTAGSSAEELIGQHINYVKNPAYAPYNFVPLNKIVVKAEQPPPENMYIQGRYTGWIALEIEACTPLYIRDTMTEKEVLEKKESNKNSDFYSPAGILRIPGSSLRGLTRSMVEMVSFGKLHFVDTEKQLYYRGLADRSNLRGEYQSRMSSYDRERKKTQYQCSAGLLMKNDRHKHGERFEILSSGGNFKQILKDKARAGFKRQGKGYSEFSWCDTGDAYIIVSGDMPNKKRDWLITKPGDDADALPIPEQDVKSYQNDATRDENVPDLIAEAKKNKTGVPCFYVEWQDDKGKRRVSFGHTGMFRLAYEKDIAAHVPTQLLDRNIIDFAEAIFGNETTHCSRVFFEDAFLTKGEFDPQQESRTPRILSTPKPTTFQHYLVQDEDEIKRLKHYNSNSMIRGYKNYWHKKSGDDWVQTDKQEIEGHPSQYTSIRPVEQGTSFNGKIRFENLTPEELGALLFSLDLPEGCAHKLGMGKPLGLGSISITPTLYLSNRSDSKRRYTDLLNEWGDNSFDRQNKKAKDCKARFEKRILQEIGEEGKERLWEVERLRELFTLLHIKTGENLEASGQTRYMGISGLNEFKNRSVLPLPTIISKSEEDKDALNSKKKECKYITNITVEDFWGNHKVDWDPFPDVNILVGVNGSGKSTLLDLINGTFDKNLSRVKNIKPKLIRIEFDNADSIIYQDGEFHHESEYEIRWDLVSTFDRRLDLGVGEKNQKDIYETELYEQLMNKVRSFNSFLKTVSNSKNRAAFSPEDRHLKLTFQETINEFFSTTKKKLEYYHKFAFVDNRYEIPNEDLKILKSTDGQLYSSEEECYRGLQDKYGKKIFSKYEKEIKSRENISDKEFRLIAD